MCRIITAHAPPHANTFQPQAWALSVKRKREQSNALRQKEGNYLRSPHEMPSLTRSGRTLSGHQSEGQSSLPFFGGAAMQGATFLSDTKEISDFYHELSIKKTNALFPKKESYCIMLYFQKATVLIQ